MCSLKNISLASPTKMTSILRAGKESYMIILDSMNVCQDNYDKDVLSQLKIDKVLRSILH